MKPVAPSLLLRSRYAYNTQQLDPQESSQVT